MLDQLGRHGGFDLTVRATGDLEVDAHHTVEDTGILLGRGVPGGARRQGRRAPVRQRPVPARRGPRRGGPRPVGPPVRGATTCPSGRCSPSATRRSTPRWPSTSGSRSPPPRRITLHVEPAAGTNTHHVVEATFKGVARMPARRGAHRRDRRPLDQGRAVTPADRRADRRARLRHRQPPLGAEGAAARRRRRPPHRRRGRRRRGGRGRRCPGVGAFGRCMEALARLGPRDVVVDAATAARDGAGVPFLGICVGMQMLFESSVENPGGARPRRAHRQGGRARTRR